MFQGGITLSQACSHMEMTLYLNENGRLCLMDSGLQEQADQSHKEVTLTGTHEKELMYLCTECIIGLRGLMEIIMQMNKKIMKKTVSRNTNFLIGEHA